MAHSQKAFQCTPSILRTVFHVEGKTDGLMTKPIAVVLLMLSLLVVAMNLGVATRIYKLRKRICDYKPAFLFIGNLAISDFLVGFFVLITFCLDLSEFSTDWKDTCCGLFTGIAIIACQETIFTIVLIAIDKYIFICHGLTYSRIVTKKRTYVLLSTSWLYSIIIAASPALGLKETVWCSCNFQEYISVGFAILLFVTAVVIPLGIMGSLYTVILSLAIKLSNSKTTFNSKRKQKSKVIRLSLMSRSSKFSRTRTTIIDNLPLSRNSINDFNLNQIDEEMQHFPAKKTPMPSENYDSSGWITRNVVNNQMSSKLDDADKKYITELKNESAIEYDRLYMIETLNLESDQKNETDTGNFHSGILPLNISAEIIQNGNHYDNVSINKPLDGESVLKELCHQTSASEINCLPKESCDHSEEEDIVDEINENILDNERKYINENKTAKSKRKTYLKGRLRNARNKAGFLKRIKAIKSVFLIFVAFMCTYFPFLIGTLIYKSQSVKNEKLFHLLNNFLYCAVVGNSVINPFIYAYGYKEFRIRTKKFKGIFARESKPKF